MSDRVDSIRNPDGIWVNVAPFSEAARHRLKYGYYCEAPWGSPDWYSYWTEQERRCKEGYSVGGAYITGDHYFYLNFCQIKLSDNKKEAKGLDKTETFPHFWDYDYNYFHFLKIARYGTTPEDLKALQLELTPTFLDGGYHMIVGKARRRGFSYKNAAICANRYNFTRNSITLIGAFEKKYLYPNGTMSMAASYLDFINSDTAWAKKREYTDKIDHKEASYKEFVNGVPVKKGFKSSIIAVSFMDNPHAARGKDATLILFEEAGAFPNLEASYMATKPTLEDGKYVVGQMVVFGTSGDMESGTQDFAKMFYEPEPYRLLPFLNIWDKEAGQGATCGFFVPDYMNKVGFMDKNGNSDKEAAIKFNEIERDNILRTASGSDTYNAYVMEYPFNPSEAFLTSSKNNFPIAALTKQLNRVRSNNLFLKKGQVVTLTKEAGSVVAKPDLTNSIHPITDYPVKQKDLTGAVIIYEWPVEKPPKGLYKIGFDPYRQNKSQTDSLGAAFVFKSYSKFSFTGDTIVAEYVGRPEVYDDAYRNVEYLAELYNAEIMFENEVTSVVDYFKAKNKLHLLAVQPDDVISAAVKNSKVARSYGIHMVEKIKDAGEKYIKKWLLSERNIDEHGNPITNLETIYSIPLLQELITYDRKLNSDRVIALMMCLIQQQQDDIDGRKPDEPTFKENISELEELIRSKYAKNGAFA